jgi:hypothetical protein
MVVRKLVRRRLLAVGLGFLATSLPMRILNSNHPGGAVALMKIRFPDGYTIDQYEFEVPTWAKNDELRMFIGAFIRDGRLVDYEKALQSSGVEYRFVFSSAKHLELFVRGVRERGLVDFESRARRGLTAFMLVNGVEFEC